MNTKELVLEAIKDLPDNSPIGDVMERLLLLAKIERGIEQADAGKTIPHEEVKQRFASLLN